MVNRRQESMIAAGSLHMLGLQLCWRPVLLTCRRLFCLRRTGGDSTSTAVIADMVYRRVVDYGLVINIVNIRDVYVIHRAVVIEGSVIPIPSLITGTAIAVAVVDAAVEADLRTPVAAIPGVGVASPAPIARSPEQTHRSQHPRARHPEVAFVPISPVARRPQIAGGGNHGLRVHR